MIGRGTSLWLKSFDTIFIGGKNKDIKTLISFFFLFFIKTFLK